MADERWAAVDRYLTGVLVPPDPVLDDALRACAEAGMPAAEVSPTQGKLLQLLARLAGARRILELGTLGGYSSIWLARALPDGGRLVTLEADPGYAEVARSNIARAGLSAVVELRVGPALETLPELDGPFDLIFIDADKTNYVNYYEATLPLLADDGVIVVDNALSDGDVVDAANARESVQAIHALNERVRDDPRVENALLTVRDGMNLIRRRRD